MDLAAIERACELVMTLNGQSQSASGALAAANAQHAMPELAPDASSSHAPAVAAPSASSEPPAWHPIRLDAASSLSALDAELSRLRAAASSLIQPSSLQPTPDSRPIGEQERSPMLRPTPRKLPHDGTTLMPRVEGAGSESAVTQGAQPLPPPTGVEQPAPPAVPHGSSLTIRGGIQRVLEGLDDASQGVMEGHALSLEARAAAAWSDAHDSIMARVAAFQGKQAALLKSVDECVQAAREHTAMSPPRAAMPPQQRAEEEVSPIPASSVDQVGQRVEEQEAPPVASVTQLLRDEDALLRALSQIAASSTSASAATVRTMYPPAASPAALSPQQRAAVMTGRAADVADELMACRVTQQSGGNASVQGFDDTLLSALHAAPQLEAATERSDAALVNNLAAVEGNADMFVSRSGDDSWMDSPELLSQVMHAYAYTSALLQSQSLLTRSMPRHLPAAGGETHAVDLEPEAASPAATNARHVSTSAHTASWPTPAPPSTGLPQRVAIRYQPAASASQPSTPRTAGQGAVTSRGHFSRGLDASAIDLAHMPTSAHRPRSVYSSSTKGSVRSAGGHSFMRDTESSARKTAQAQRVYA